MNKILKYIFLFLIVNFSGISGYGQDAQFSQFYSAPLYMAPSFAGSTGGGRLITNYRDQWPKLRSTYITYSLSADYYFSKYRSGVGLLLFRDVAGKGLLNVTNLGLNYSFNFNINKKWSIRPGLQSYYYWKNIDYNILRFGDQILRSGGNGSSSSPSLEMTDLLNIEPVKHVDFTTSVLAYSDQYWIGFTIDHLMNFSKTLSSRGDYLSQRYALFGGGKYDIRGRTIKRKEESVTGAFNFLTQDKLKYLDLGAYYTLEPVSFGLWYRGLPVFADNPNIGAITLLFSYKYKAFRFGYSYDFTTSKLITQTGGAHEISLIYSFVEKTRKKVRHHAVPCPGM
jgi:type IX secretion system PorP/SprF family membrane protein